SGRRAFRRFWRPKPPKAQSLKPKARKIRLSMILDPSRDRRRLEREVRTHKRLRGLLLLFSRGVSSGLGLNAALGTLTPEIRDILGAGSVEIWLHDRRNRQLVLAASSEGGGPLGAKVLFHAAPHYAEDAG